MAGDISVHPAQQLSVPSTLCQLNATSDRHFTGMKQVCPLLFDHFSIRAEDISFFCDVDSWWLLLSASTSELTILTTQLSTFNDRTYHVPAACTWNSLPADVMSSPSLSVFDSQLKTYQSVHPKLSCITACFCAP